MSLNYFITGTSSGIGRALALEALVDADAHVTGISRRRSIEHARYAHLEMDLSVAENYSSFQFPELKNARRIVLVNNAGYLGHVAHAGKINSAETLRAYQVNLLAPAVLSNAFIRQYHNLKCERIILNISSGAAQRPIDGWSTYCSSKAGLDMLSRTMQEDCKFEKNGIRIFSVAPGVVDTEMQSMIRKTQKEDFSTVDRFKGLKEYGELLHPEVVARKLLRFIEQSRDLDDVIMSLSSIA